MSMMSLQMSLDDLYSRWFRIADTNQDGSVAGGEAVSFFMPKAGLAQDVLSQIWQIGSNGAYALDHASFRRICQLIWYAQANGNQLPADSKGVVMKIISGMAMLPPPKLAGLDVPFSLQDMKPVGVDVPQPQPPQRAQSQGYGTPQGYGMPMQQQYSGYSQPPTGSSHISQDTQSSSHRDLPSSFASGITGTVPLNAPATAGQFGAPPTSSPGFPAITTNLATKYGDMFKSAKKDSEGCVDGGEVLRLLASVPVDNNVKKQAWDLVAGNRGLLTAHEFFTLLYLLDVHTVQHTLPPSIPPGVFPSQVHLCFQAASMPVPTSLLPHNIAHVPLADQNPVENLALQAEGYKDQKWSMDMHAVKEVDPLAAMPPIPPKDTYEASAAADTYSAAGRVPDIDAARIAGMTNASEQQRLQTDLKAAGTTDKALFAAERAFASAKEEEEFYTHSLQQLKLFRGRSDRALLDVQSRADAARREAQESKLRYEQMYTAARASAGNHEELQKHITEAMASKAEWESKVQVLQQELRSLANATPELLEQLQYEVEQLEGMVADLEAEKSVFTDQTAGLRAGKAQLQGRVQEVRDVLKASEETKEHALIRLNDAKQELDFTKTGEDAESLIAALEDAASVYKSLFIKAREAGVAVPRSAAIASDTDAVWQKEDLIGAQDWMRFESTGWAVVDELPDLPEDFNVSYFLAHQPASPPEAIVPVIMSDDPFIDLPEPEVEETEADEEEADKEKAEAAEDAETSKDDEAPAEATKDDKAPAAAEAAAQPAVTAGGNQEGNVVEHAVAPSDANGSDAAPPVATAAEPSPPDAIAEGVAPPPSPLDELDFSQPPATTTIATAADDPVAPPPETDMLADLASLDTSAPSTAPPTDPAPQPINTPAGTSRDPSADGSKHTDRDSLFGAELLSGSPPTVVGGGAPLPDFFSVALTESAATTAASPAGPTTDGSTTAAAGNPFPNAGAVERPVADAQNPFPAAAPVTHAQQGTELAAAAATAGTTTADATAPESTTAIEKANWTPF